MEDLFMERSESQMPKIQKGIRFCESCQNMLVPKEEDKMLTFVCRSCDYKVSVKDQNSEEENLIYKKDIKIQSNKALANHNFVIDPTMSRTKDVTCPKCSYGEAIYYMTSDFEDSKLIKQFICAKLNNDQAPACGFVWTSEDKDLNLQDQQQENMQELEEGRQNNKQSQQSNIEEESMEEGHGGYNLNQNMDDENNDKQQVGPLVDDEFLDSEDNQEMQVAVDDDGEQQYQMDNEEDDEDQQQQFFGKADDDDEGQEKIEN